MASTTTVATLGPAVRLVIFKFLMRSELVPDFVPRIPVNRTGTAPSIRGKEILPSTPDVHLSDLAEWVADPFEGDYKFVGARVADERGDGKSDVRFTLCHHTHLDDNPRHPDFASRIDRLNDFFLEETRNSLWSVQGYLNPYLLENGIPTKHSVLMLNCARRKPVINPDGSPVMVYEGGREKPAFPGQFTQGIGPKVLLTDKANQLKLVRNEVQLITR